jgi:bleomycin hydrolase
MSLKQFPYWTQDEYPVPDNWWHSKDYYNVPLDVFMDIVNHAIENGYTICIGGDVSEPGFDRQTQCAIVPTFDIPAQYIDENARQFRFSNHTTTDDHGMHLVGYTDYKGQRWYLIKDSGSGSRNNGEDSPNFGYYFFRQDYMKLKIMDIMVHKDALPKDVRKKLGIK